MTIDYEICRQWPFFFFGFVAAALIVLFLISKHADYFFFFGSPPDKTKLIVELGRILSLPLARPTDGLLRSCDIVVLVVLVVTESSQVVLWLSSNRHRQNGRLQRRGSKRGQRRGSFFLAFFPLSFGFLRLQIGCDKNKPRTFNIFMLNVFETKKGVL